MLASRAALALLTALGAAAYARAAAPLTQATLSLPDTAGGGTGTVVHVPISITPGDGVLGIDMTIQYASAVLTAQNVTVSGIAAAQNFSLVQNLNNPGVIVISTYANQNALVGSGVIADIQFLVGGSFGATSPLHFASATINENGITAVLDDGTFTVTCAGATNGTACDDGNSCTANDTCQAGACTGVPPTAPAEVGGFAVAADKTTLSWTPATGGPGTVHDVAKGLLSQLPVGTGAGESCLASGIAAATASDGATPSATTGYWYLVRGRNACATGTYGFRRTNGAPGAERTSSTCP